jgi:hypothetical protein
VRHSKRKEHDLPPGEVEGTVRQEVEQGIQQGIYLWSNEAAEPAGVKNLKAYLSNWPTFYCKRRKCL